MHIQFITMCYYKIIFIFINPLLTHLMTAPRTALYQ